MMCACHVQLGGNEGGGEGNEGGKLGRASGEESEIELRQELGANQSIPGESAGTRSAKERQGHH